MARDPRVQEQRLLRHPRVLPGLGPAARRRGRRLAAALRRPGRALAGGAGRAGSAGQPGNVRVREPGRSLSRSSWSPARCSRRAASDIPCSPFRGPCATTSPSTVGARCWSSPARTCPARARCCGRSASTRCWRWRARPCARSRSASRRWPWRRPSASRTRCRTASRASTPRSSASGRCSTSRAGRSRRCSCSTRSSTGPTRPSAASGPRRSSSRCSTCGRSAW